MEYAGDILSGIPEWDRTSTESPHPYSSLVTVVLPIPYLFSIPAAYHVLSVAGITLDHLMTRFKALVRYLGNAHVFVECLFRLKC